MLEKIINELKKKDIFIFNSIFNIDEPLVRSWLNNRNFSANLLYRMTEDGIYPNDFHKKCDNKGTTIVFVETEDGDRFGGYTELEWDRSNTDKKDESTFIFSFNSKEKYIRRNNNYSIGYYETEGPKFGWGPQIGFLNTIDLKHGSSIYSSSNTFELKKNTLLMKKIR